jgi:hypothetical protein
MPIRLLPPQAKPAGIFDRLTDASFQHSAKGRDGLLDGPHVASVGALTLARAGKAKLVSGMTRPSCNGSRVPSVALLPLLAACRAAGAVDAGFGIARAWH